MLINSSGLTGKGHALGLGDTAATFACGGGVMLICAPGCKDGALYGGGEVMLICALACKGGGLHGLLDAAATFASGGKACCC